ncbi:MAG: hypothetical protein WAN48_09430 [Actinomycetes bacterium]
MTQPTPPGPTVHRPSAARAGTSDRLMLTGVVVFAVGALAAVVALVPLLVGADPLPTAVYLLSVLAPVGLGMVLWGIWQTARRSGQSDRARRSGQSTRAGRR